MRTFLLVALTWAACEAPRDDLEERTARVMEARKDVTKAEEDVQKAQARLSQAKTRLDTSERELQMQVETLGAPPAEPGVQPAIAE